MSTLLNQKEEVLKIELTKHGRKMFGMGLFKPHYFYFFDNSVIYDNSYAGISDEDTNLVKQRIMDDSLTFSSLNNTDDILKYKLGTSDTINDYMPAWSLKMLRGFMTYDRDNSIYSHKIFDTSDIVYTIRWNPEMEDATIDTDYLLFDIGEINLSDDIANFEIELVAYDKLTGGKVPDNEKKLSFYNKRTNVIDDILYEENELPSKFFDIEITTEDVQYYFDILVDDEIDTEYLVPRVKTLPEKITGTYVTAVPPIVDKKC